ncbi:MAG: L-2-hydroxyglutarate oxidase [Bacteroidetes bacterium]|nr:L-2-hydroxyglutarate oxidase [Bacteroidota bacterium]
MYDIIVAGAGIVGLSSALKLLEKNPKLKLLIIEKEEGVSRHQTGNNSGVIHSGIYYKPGSLKAVNCTRGCKMLLDFCNENEIEYDICGKIIVATNDGELPALKNIFDRGTENGLAGLRYIEKEEMAEFEPYVSGVKGVHVPQTGIIDYKQVSEKIHELLLRKGAEIIFGERLEYINEKSDFVETATNREYYESKMLLTCCGLQSDRIAKLNNKNLDISIIPFRGEYYKIKKEKSYLVKNLIYPVPDPQFPFLGVHYTRKMNGEIEAGPNAVFAFGRECYGKFDVNVKDLFESLTWRGFVSVAGKFWKTGMMEFYRSFSKPAFTKALQKLTPSIMESDLETGGAGIRAQACSRDGKLVDDFLFIENKRVLHVCNAPSPAATSCFSIGDTIATKFLS